MNIDPIGRFSMNAPVAIADVTLENMALMQELVSAIAALNRPELLARGHEMKLRRGPANRKPVIELVDSESGEVLDELSPEDVLRMKDELEKSPQEEL